MTPLTRQEEEAVAAGAVAAVVVEAVVVEGVLRRWFVSAAARRGTSLAIVESQNKRLRRNSLQQRMRSPICSSELVEAPGPRICLIVIVILTFLPAFETLGLCST